MKTLMGDVTVWRVRACLVSPSLYLPSLFSLSRLSPLPPTRTAALPRRGAVSARARTAESCQCILYTVLTRLTKTEL